MVKKRWSIFINSLFFVLGFSIIFSLIGVLLQTVLSNVAYTVKNWLGYVGGTIIIFFGLFLLGLIRIPFLEREHKFHVKRKFKYAYFTSFIFGAAFAIGWTPCVTAALGAILALASTQSSSAFALLLAYTLGLGIPFLLVGFFTTKAQNLINKTGKWLKYFQYSFGVILIIIGILIFAGQLSRISNSETAVKIITSLNYKATSLFGIHGGVEIKSLNLVNLFIAFVAGLVSFLSPCVLPLVPGFLSYLGTTATTNATLSEKEDNLK